MVSTEWVKPIESSIHKVEFTGRESNQLYQRHVTSENWPCLYQYRILMTSLEVVLVVQKRRMSPRIDLRKMRKSIIVKGIKNSCIDLNCNWENGNERRR